MTVLLVLTILALASLSSAADEIDCNDLVKPLVLEDRGRIFGKWILHVGGWDDPALKTDLATVKSSWIELTPTSESDIMTIYWADRLHDEKCMQGETNASLTGTTSHATFNIHGHTSYHDGKYYETCPDCLLTIDTTLLPDGQSKGRYVFLFTRTGGVDESQLETFKQQAKCLNFLPDYYYTSATDLCDDARETTTASETTAPTE